MEVKLEIYKPVLTKYVCLAEAMPVGICCFHGDPKTVAYTQSWP